MCYKGDPCAQFQAADAEASAIAAAAQKKNRNGAVPASEARTSPAPKSVTKDSKVAPPLQPAAWNVTTGVPSSAKLEHTHILS